MKAFNIDFNWSKQGDSYSAATPGLFCQANPQKIVDWYEQIGADTFWTFATTYNGYAWYDSDFAPKTPNLQSDFTGLTTALGKAKGMSVFAYICMTANPWWGAAHPENVRPNEAMNIVPDEAYLSHVANVIKESASRYEFDGFAIDWFRSPGNKREIWLDSEKALYERLMSEAFPSNAFPDKAYTDIYDKKLVEYMWDFLSNEMSTIRKVKIWANEPFQAGEDAIWQDNRFLNSIDYTLNESFDLSLVAMIKKYAPKLKVIQNICGWAGHDLSSMKLSDYEIDGLFGFAQADEVTCIPEPLSNSTNAGDIMDINYKNILKTKEIYLKTK